MVLMRPHAYGMCACKPKYGESRGNDHDGDTAGMVARRMYDPDESHGTFQSAAFQCVIDISGVKISKILCLKWEKFTLARDSTLSSYRLSMH